MAPKRNNAAAGPTTETTTPSTTKIPSKSSANANLSPQEVAHSIWKNYLDNTPQRTKLIDVFMAFLVVVGGLQFLYCLLVGNYVGCHSTLYVGGIVVSWMGHLNWGIESLRELC
jgi:oligosaccharyltransferase complex subunit epsilon